MGVIAGAWLHVWITDELDDHPAWELRPQLQRMVEI